MPGLRGTCAETEDATDKLYKVKILFYLVSEGLVLIQRMQQYKNHRVALTIVYVSEALTLKQRMQPTKSPLNIEDLFGLRGTCC